MRQIKFRAWNKNDGKMVDLQKITPLALAADMNTQLAMKGESGLFIPFCNGIEIMQYTGLLDKNGKEIYEGDIIRFSYGIPGRSVNAPVEFINGAFFVITKGHNPDKCLIGELEEYIGEYEIIGNIYENPELLDEINRKNK